MKDLHTSINTIKHLQKKNVVKKYINHIQFPFYRNLENNTKISFEFPLTVFIGQNGCGKSSTLHALWGSVQGNTPYKFWFDTKVDPIEYYDDEKRRHSFWYGYNDEKNEINEVVKARIRRENDPNYWETSRPLVWAGMKKGRRNKPINKNTIYLDFRAELSAFDKFFYFGNMDYLKSRNKQEFIRRKSSALKSLLDGNKIFIKTRRRKLNEEIETLDEAELKIISFILGRKYISGKSLLHYLFRLEGYSIYFETTFANYSEAFAGSGEMAVVRLVKEILNAPEYSLILLDEPEVSLHPGAQERLKLFILNEIIKKKHQIILSTHSPSIIKGLPKESIKVFFQNPRTGRFIVKEELLPEEAFFHIEFSSENYKWITVEDKLSKILIETVLDTIGPESSSLIKVRYNPGGETVIKNEFISVYCRNDFKNEFVVFDGDQKKVNQHSDWRTLNTKEITIFNLTNKIKEQTGVKLDFSVDGGIKGGNENQKIDFCKKYLDFFLSNVYYLPEKIPEDIIWDHVYAKQLIQIHLGIEKTENEMEKIEIRISTKQKFNDIAKILFTNVTSVEMESLHKMFIKNWKQRQATSFNEISKIIENIKTSE